MSSVPGENASRHLNKNVFVDASLEGSGEGRRGRGVSERERDREREAKKRGWMQRERKLMLCIGQRWEWRKVKKSKSGVTEAAEGPW